MRKYAKHLFSFSLSPKDGFDVCGPPGKRSSIFGNVVFVAFLPSSLIGTDPLRRKPVSGEILSLCHMTRGSKSRYKSRHCYFLLAHFGYHCLGEKTLLSSCFCEQKRVWKQNHHSVCVRSQSTISSS